MSVPGELQIAYNRASTALERLKAKSELTLRGIANSEGARYEGGRIKPVESVLATIERDGLADPLGEINDLFAARIVAPNQTIIPRIEAKLEESFEIVEKSPPRTRKPEEFIYDDLHIILKLRSDRVGNDTEISHITFELQIKTEMQAAASIVSRDLSYKTRWVSWTKHRLAGSIRALVEMADRLLVNLAESQQEGEEPPKEDYELFASRNGIIKLLGQVLAPEQLPDDNRRLAITVERYLKLCKPEVRVDELEQILTKDDYARIREASSLSAAASVFIVLFLEGKLSGQPADPHSLYGNRRYLISSEMTDLCPRLRDVPEDRRVLLN